MAWPLAWLSITAAPSPLHAQDEAQAQRVRILALRVDFPLEDPDEPTTSGVGRFDLRSLSAALPDYLLPYDTPPHDRAHYELHLGALARYYDVVSEGRVAIEAEVFPRADTLAYTLPKSALLYGNGRTPEEIGRLWRELLVDAVTLADVDPDGPVFDRYDSYLIIHAGLGHETGQLNDVRSVFLGPADLEEYGGAVIVDGHTIWDAWILPEAVDDRGRAGLNGLMAKFFGHQLGLPGLSNFARGLPAVGGWSLMDVGANRIGFVLVEDELEFVFGVVPPHPLAWSKARLGWIDPLTVTRDTMVTILAGDRTPAPGSGSERAVRIPLSPTESLLLESRQQRSRTEFDLPAGVQSPFGDLEMGWIEPGQALLSHTIAAAESDSLAGRAAGVWLEAEEYDAFIPGSGVLVWHVDDAVIEAAPEGFNNVRERLGLALVEADGFRDIGNAFFERQDLTEGTRSDPFYVGAAPGGDPGNDRFGADTSPATTTNTGLATGVEVLVLSEPGDTMTVRIRFARSAGGWPRPFLGSRRLQAADLDDDGAVELIAEADGSIAVFSPSVTPTQERRALGSFVAAGAGRILAASDGGVAALSYPGLDPIWESDVQAPPGAGLLSPALFGQQAFVAAGEAGLRVLAAADGALLLRDDEPVSGLAAADVDGDGADELFTTSPSKVRRFDEATATDLDGPSVGELLSPAAGDLDGDGHADWVLATAQGRILSSGQDRELRVDLGEALVGPPSLADVNGDGTLEILALTADRLHVLTASGLRAAGFPVAPPVHHEAGPLAGEPVAADLDGDGAEEVFAVAAAGVYGFDGDGALLAGFPVLTPQAAVAGPVLGDATGDGAVEVAAVSGDAVHLWRPASWAEGFGVGTAPGWAQAGGTGGSRARGPATAPIGPLPGDLLPGQRAYCYPNPVGGEDLAHVRFFLARDARVGLTVYDAVGELVERIGTDDARAAADNEISWSIRGYASGLYLCRLSARGDDGSQGQITLRMAVSQ